MLLEDMEQFFSVFWPSHIDKINQNDTGEIAQPELVGNLSGGLQIDLAVGLLRFFLAGEFTGVHVDGHKSFRLLYHEKATAF